MLEVKVYDTSGKNIDTIEVSDDVFGSTVNTALVKQAVVAYHANTRQGTVATKSRGMVKGSTRKMFRQKGTGNARRGTRQANILRGGGVTFAKVNRDFRQRLPKKMRRAALNSAILAKILGQDLMVIRGLEVPQPKTSQMAELMKNLKINRSCLLALAGLDRNIYLSSRNIQDLTVRITDDLNASDVATRQKMLVTSEGMKALMSREAGQ